MSCVVIYASHSAPGSAVQGIVSYGKVLQNLLTCTSISGSPEPGRSCPSASQMLAVVQVWYLPHLLLIEHKFPVSSGFLKDLFLIKLLGTREELLRRREAFASTKALGTRGCI